MEFLLKLCEALKHIRVLLNLWFDFVIYKFGKNKIHRNESDISGKCVVVTGGSSGIGKSCAKEFAQRGAIVVIGDKNFETGRNTVEEIRRDTGNNNVTILHLDLSDMDSVENFARQVSTKHPKIKILLNNAGIGASKDENVKTKDGFNIHVAVNYIGHFLLTNLLMENLKAEIKSRIVSITSTLLLGAELNIDDLNMDKSRFGFMNHLPYSNTKCMLALFTKELGKQNYGVNAYALCPGLVDTAIFDDVPLHFKLVVGFSRFFTTSPNEAASNFVLQCALEKSLENETGKIYRFRRNFHSANKKLETYSERYLYETSAKLVDLNRRRERLNKSTKNIEMSTYTRELGSRC